MKKTKILASVLGLSIMFMTVAPVVENLGSNFVITASAADTDYTRTLNDDGTVTITKYTGNETDVVIPDTLGGRTVTALGQGAFSGNKVIKSVKCPEYLKTINGTGSLYGGVFRNCINLENVEFNDGLEKIGYGAFESCSSLKNLKIPNTVNSISEVAFKNCKSIKSIELSSSLKEISPGTFLNCSNLTRIVIPPSVKTVGRNAFQNCKSLSSVVIKEGVEKIGYGAFDECGLKSVTIPKSVNRIDNYSFGYNSNDKVSDFKIYCYRDTTGEVYAMKYGFDYEFLDAIPQKGDITADGVIDSADVIKAASYVKGTGTLTEEAQAMADVTGDGKIDTADVVKLAACVKGLTTID